MYMASIQQGIQTGHMAVDLVRKYCKGKISLEYDLASEWADNHKTFIVSR